MTTAYLWVVVVHGAGVVARRDCCCPARRRDRRCRTFESVAGDDGVHGYGCGRV